MSFENLVGNEKVKELLNQTIKLNKVLHSYLFCGIEGIGKCEFAKEFAKAILCINETNKPCNTCKSCVEYEAGSNPDFMIIDVQDSKAIKIEQIRYMQEKIVEKPVTSNKKVYIINDSDLMTQEAENCLLKTLEEPPEYAVIILVATNESKLLNTIKSRCTKVPFERIKDDDLKQYARKNLQLEINSEKLMIAQGSIKNLLNLVEKQELYDEIRNLIHQMEKKDLVDILNNSDFLYSSKENIYEILDYIIVILYYTKELKKMKCIKYVEDAKKSLNSNSNYDMTIDYLLLKMWEEINEKYCRG